MAQGIVSDDTPLGSAVPPAALDFDVDIDFTGRTTVAGQPVASTLETLGAQVDQAQGQTVRNRFLALIRDVGDGSLPAGGLRYSGGDVTDGLLSAAGTVLWTMADWLSTLTVANDLWTSNPPFGPLRNGVLAESVPGTFSSQVYAGAVGQSNWLDAVTQGGLPAGHLWWPLTVVQDANDVVHVGAWFVDSTITALAPYGTVLDSHIVTLSIFASHASHTATNIGPADKTFFVQCMRRAAPHIFILGAEFQPPFERTVAGGPSYAFGDLATLQGQADIVTRIARAPDTALTNVAGWEFWDGAAWVPGVANAAPLETTDGTVIHGSAGIHQVKTGHWLMVAHQMVDTHLDVYSASQPQGPWTPVARVPLPTIGVDISGGSTIAWHCKIVGHLTAPAEHSVAMLSAWWAGQPASLIGENIRRFTPLFVVVPWY